MTRLLACALFALALPSSASATLVVIVPSAAGLIVAADSRTSLFGALCDSQYKIAELGRPKRTFVAVTGDVAFIAPPNPGEKDVCEYQRSAPRLLDISSVVARYLKRKGADPFQLSLDDLGAECVAAVEAFRRTHPLVFEQYVGREIFSVVIASYDRRSKRSLVLNLAVRIEQVTRHVEATRLSRIAISPQDRRGMWSYGEADYLNKNVFGGVGRMFLTAETMSFVLVDKPVSEARLDQAVSVATNVIDAASRTAQLIPSPSGIGGPIDVILLGKGRRPLHIQWKDNE
jgi:hypothetical protein